MSNTVRVANQLGEGNAVVQDGAGTVTAGTHAGGSPRYFNVFKFVTNTVFSDITSDKITNVADLETETFSAGDEVVLPGVTTFTVTSGIVIAYYKV